MEQEQVTKSKFKAKALEYFRQVETFVQVVWLSGHSELSENARAAIEEELQESSGAYWYRAQ